MWLVTSAQIPCFWLLCFWANLHATYCFPESSLPPSVPPPICCLSSLTLGLLIDRHYLEEILLYMEISRLKFWLHFWPFVSPGTWTWDIETPETALRLFVCVCCIVSLLWDEKWSTQKPTVIKIIHQKGALKPLIEGLARSSSPVEYMHIETCWECRMRVHSTRTWNLQSNSKLASQWTL